MVDNASSDGTPELLAEEFPEVETLRLAQNEGGAGGFHAGMRRAFDHGADWLWLLDDDTIAEPDALAALLEALDRVPGEPPSVLASKVVWDDGRIHPMNRVLPRIHDVDDLVDAAANGLLAIRFATFVSALIARGAVERHGLPHKHFFLWSDDIEYTARVLRRERGYLVPASVAHHRTARPHDALDAPPERFYLAVRNGIWTARGEAFAGRERISHVLGLIYTAATYLARRRFAPRALLHVARAVRDGLLGPYDRRR